MVHVKRLELTNFKSFGGTTQIPMLPGFTVVSGPNGSGKSNILDALLFCLGLSSSKGMRAERLPDLVNHNKERRSTVEARVTVTFDLSDAPDILGVEEIPENSESDAEKEEETEEDNPNSQPLTPQSTEWTVTRRLRVTKQNTYTSTYYINGESCTLTQLHEQLNRLRVYPEGYNVVLQGDVTSIISMNSRERREIIDELAGVAAFDRKITQTKDTLNEVKEREDRCRIIEKELITQRDRLAADRIKAEKYKKLRAELQEKQQWELVLKWRSLQQQVAHLISLMEKGEQDERQLTQQLHTIESEIRQGTEQLATLNTRVKALGEEEQVAVSATLASQDAERRQLQRRQQELIQNLADTEANQQNTQNEIQQQEERLQQLQAERHHLDTQIIASRRQEREAAQTALNASREQADAIASASEAWVQHQNTLTRQIEARLQTLNPQRTEQAQLQERHNQLSRQIDEQTQILERIAPELASKQTQAAELEGQLNAVSQQIQTLAQTLAANEQELQTQRQTQTRLLSEQRDKQRQLDKLEAQAQAQQEAQGTYATKIVLQADIPGVHGLVAQLGRVEPHYQLALETSAGGRLGHVVVEDDAVAAVGIELLKQKRAGRATFLPLNKIKPPRFSPIVALRHAQGFIDYAVHLIDCEPRYQTIFAYVFGSTVVFETLSTARPYLGQCRIVTLDGELLESSGAMTGGSSSYRSGLHFGISDTSDSAEMMALRDRLQDIEAMLKRCDEWLERESATAKQLTQTLTDARETRSQTQLRLEQSRKDIQGLTEQQTQVRSLLAKNTQEVQTAAERLQQLNQDLPAQERQLQALREQLAQLEAEQTPQEWQQIQSQIKTQEAVLGDREQALREAEKQLQALENQHQRTNEQLATSYQRIAEYQTQHQSIQEQQAEINRQLEAIEVQIEQTQARLTQLEQRLGEAKQERDRVEAILRNQHLNQQKLSWQRQKLQETQVTRQEKLTTLQTQLEIQQAELPDPLPEVSLMVETGDKGDGGDGEDKEASRDIPAERLEDEAGNQQGGEAGLVSSGSQENDSRETHPYSISQITVQLEKLQRDIRNGQKRLEAMEPVNMLALEEYDHTQARLQELSEKLATLEAERTELLLRIENFTTLRLRAFKESFDAINQNFQTIFAELSEGDGHLQLDDTDDPFNGGLNLVAHPKGKPVQRLASMSGGEKSLTALSFIFALQRYRPSPFYAFDEVDMFLDGANVERLARMIKQQAKLAQFIVVSLRRPMIESAERTIGVTQARGAYTQVLGLKLGSAKRD
ncbi:chromosome segregation protein SMC [Coleofasciculus chthonoplastes PCC 7420]|uniref:Chromosome partition protein Smc n=1 Tax=Coleofasciculus chthonoplastes PCC 7420 TaxID=118168 RepID=B4W3G7_9CYAN|nr:chromosome segregation protein SMC [Coleofasciculus chthonoplastes]EDX71268.1 chromosome segregation protein SMC [Coleofasciculus chthonoplastes PCC 7420]